MRKLILCHLKKNWLTHLQEESVKPEDLLDGSLEEDSEEEEEEEEEAPSELPEAVILPLPYRVVSDKLGPSLESQRSI